MAQGCRKAETYLRLGTSMAWLVHMDTRSAEMWITADDGSLQRETVDADSALSGGAVLPGFSPPLRRVFHPQR